MKHEVHQDLSEFMDLARWVSAFLVLITHVANRMLERLGSIKGPNLMEYGWGFVAGFAHHAVVVFFVLSGFLVGGKILAERKNFSPGVYAIDRSVRIYLVLIPVLILTAILDIVGLTSFGLPVYPDEVGTHLGPGVFLGNVASLQLFVVPTYGTNGPLGTLANEVWYYITFPLLLAPLLKIRYANLCCAVGLVVLAWQTYVLPEHGVGFVLWIIGAAAANLRGLRASPRLAIVAFIVLLVGLRLGVRSEAYDFLLRTVTDILVAGSFGYALYSLRWGGLKVPFGRMHKSLADFSYSLYAMHAPVVTFCAALLYANTGWGWQMRAQTWWHWLAVFGVVGAALLAAYLLSFITERHTGKVRRYFRRRLLDGQGSPATAVKGVNP